ncbi:hypothetical protein ACVXG9_12485 [Escherichia coli]
MDFAQNEKIESDHRRPEAPLVKGVVDTFRAAGLKTSANRRCGPTGRLKSVYPKISRPAIDPYGGIPELHRGRTCAGVSA